MITGSGTYYARNLTCALQAQSGIDPINSLELNLAHNLRDLFGQVVKNLGDNMDILPAVGGAVEDMERPDEDEMEDR
ncbi:MAG: hypothetical protein M1305_04370 [Candidatus Marsarchaeota archaeon]|nr:hypothetical protein [Candidatus Marsarchaeota archaeon]